MRITYHGPHDGVELAALHDVVVARDQTIEVDDELGASLVEQSTWDTSPEEVLGWIDGADDVDTARDRAQRLLVAERNGAQRTELLDVLEHWLKDQAGADDSGNQVAPTPVENPPVAQAEPLADPSADPPDESTDSPATPARTRKGAK